MKKPKRNLLDRIKSLFTKPKRKVKKQRSIRGEKRVVGKILKTDDIVLSDDGYSKPGRRVVVSQQYTEGFIGVNKIKKMNPKKRYQKKRVIPITRKHPSITIKSGVDAKVHQHNYITGSRLSIHDSQLTDTGDKFNQDELRRLSKHIHRSRKRK